MCTPDRIGPYRLGEPLGAGGMGAVYLAWDKRLGRQVAIKHVLPEFATEARRRKRLRREAWAVAQLSHPAIVQVYDIVETEDGDWVVMEYVEGRSLAHLLHAGPLSMARVLTLAREIAEGLGEAHGKGFLHRDLKVENVLVTPSGHAKILDFGLVKRYWPSPSGPLEHGKHGDFSDTSTHGVIGTRRTMSPEQIRGLELDPRSDLFSFGNLLYETVTGVSPFRGPSPVETLDRVCHHQQSPPCEINPEVPAELSALIDSLLDKDRERRPRSAHEVAERLARLEHVFSRGSSASLTGSSAVPLIEDETIVQATAMSLQGNIDTPSGGTYQVWRRRGPILIALVAALTAGFFSMKSIRREPLYVAVAPPEIGVGQDRDEIGLLAAGVHTALTRGLIELRGVAVLQPERGEDLPGSAREVTTVMATDEVLTSRLDCKSDVCTVTLRRHQGANGRLRWVETIEVPVDDFALLVNATIACVRRGYPGFKARPGVERLAVRSEDYKSYLRLYRIYQNRQEGGSLDDLLAQLKDLRRTSPRFLEAYLLEARWAYLKFFSSRRPRDLEQALDLLDQARKISAEDPRPLIQLFYVFLVMQERLDEAERIFRDLEPLMPGDVRILQIRALLLESHGEKSRALELMRTVARRRPSSYFLAELAEMEIRLGEFETAHLHLEELLRRFPRHFQGASMLARLELSSGNAERAAELYGNLIEISPGLAELSNLGTAQMLLGRYAEAAASFRAALTKFPTSPLAMLNLADAQLLQERPEEARELYGRVLALFEEDPAASHWQSLTVRAQALAHLGRAREAVTHVQQALHQAPENPQTAYEAALVYSLVGDESSALVHAERALAGGVEHCWFRFPWFDALRHEISLAALTTQEDRR